MFLFTTPILTIISVLGLAFFYALLISAQKIEIIRKICLFASFAALLVGVLAGLSFDKAAVGFQYLSTFNYVGEYNSSLALGVDGLSYVFLLLTLVIFPFLFLAAWTVSKFPKHFFCHLLAMELLLVLTFVAVDLFYFFILFESLLIPMFILIGVWGARTRKIKAAYYFFLYTLFGSLFMLFGIIYLYQITGSLNYHVLLSEQLDISTQKLLWLCFFLAFAVKMPLFPFHIWLPEAHVEAPTVGSMLLASLLLKLGGYGLLRFSLTLLADASIVFTPLVSTLAVAGVIYGSLSTMRQVDLKRIIAYSSVAHMNLVALGIFSFNRIGIEGSIYLMVAHGVVSAALFFCVGVVYDRTHTRLLRYYGGLVTVMPVFATFFFIFNLANMGFPGTPNFVGELLMLAGIFALAPAILFFAAWGIVFSAAYSTNLFAKVMFGTLKTQHITQFVDVNRREAFILLVFVVFSAILGLRSDLVLVYVEAVVWNIADFNSAATISGAATFSVPSPSDLEEVTVFSLFAGLRGRWGARGTGTSLLLWALFGALFLLCLVIIRVDLPMWWDFICTNLAAWLDFISERTPVWWDFIGTQFFLYLNSICTKLPVLWAFIHSKFLVWLDFISERAPVWCDFIRTELTDCWSAICDEFPRWYDLICIELPFVMPLLVILVPVLNALLLITLNRFISWRLPLLLVLINYALLILTLFRIFLVMLQEYVFTVHLDEWFCADCFEGHWSFTIDWWRYTLLVSVFIFSLLELLVLLEDLWKHSSSARLVTYLILRTLCMAVAVMSTDLTSLFAASEGVSVLTYFITRFWSLRGWPERFARGAFLINQAADLFLLAASYLLYSVFKTTSLYDISISFSGVTALPLSFFGSAVSPLSLSSTLLVLWVIGKAVALGIYAKAPKIVGGTSPAVTFMHATLALVFFALFILHFLLLILVAPPLVFGYIVGVTFFAVILRFSVAPEGPPFYINSSFPPP